MRHFFSRRMLGYLGAAALAMAVLAVPTAARAYGEACGSSSGTTNWSGYVACTSTYTSVTATWTQPQVSCTSAGNASFWVGLDGYGTDTSTLEQTGTSVSCASGSPQYSAWWELVPANPTFYNEPVYPGDTIVASVTYEGSDTYSLKLTDTTRGWAENTTINAVAQNATAEVIAEATRVNGQTSALPNFTAVQFTNTAINGGSLQSANAQVLDMTGVINQPPIAYATTPPTSAGFTDFYSGGLGSAAAAAFEGFNPNLYSYSAPGLAETNAAMMAGTSPAITELSNGTYEMAYQSSAGYLTLLNSGTITNTFLPMKAGTSPAIAASGGSYQVAFQYSTGSMWTYSPSAGAVNQSQGMLAGTSPAITALAGGGYEMAFQANTGILILYGSGGNINTGLGMKAGTSPSISAAGGGFEAAMQANTGVLWTYGTNGTADLGLGMASGTSPAIAGLTTGGYELAFQTNTGVLEVYGQAADLNTGFGMAASTSPAITAVAGGGYETAFQENTSDFTVWGTAGNVQTNQAMSSGTSPSITG